MAIGQTPVIAIRVAVGRRSARLRLKLESFNPRGSIAGPHRAVPL